MVIFRCLVMAMGHLCLCQAHVWFGAALGQNDLVKYRVGRVVMKLFARFAKCESGATAIEYGLIAALIGVAIIGAVTNVGTGINSTFGNVSAKL